MIFTFVGWRCQGQRQRCKVQEMPADNKGNCSVKCDNFHLESGHFEIDLVHKQRTFPFLPGDKVNPNLWCLLVTSIMHLFIKKTISAVGFFMYLI